MISSTPRHCWKSGGVAAQSSVTRPLVCWARRVAKRSATADSLVLSITTRNLRGLRWVPLMGSDAGIRTAGRQDPAWRSDRFPQHSDQAAVLILGADGNPQEVLDTGLAEM